MSGVELGCGLIAIGRPWGTTPEVPSEADALAFLEAAYDEGVRFFDTAPAYGLSEERLGKFVTGLSAAEREEVTVATKFGEFWDSQTGVGSADHSYDALRRSLDRSLELLGTIDILQLHKTTDASFEDPNVSRAFSYARELGLACFGVSVSSPDVAERAVADPRFRVVQLPYNQASAQFTPSVQAASDANKFVITNRPFQMGQVATSPDRRAAAVEAFGFILSTPFDGVVLTGTSNAQHLRQNMQAFTEAKQAREIA